MDFEAHPLVETAWLEAHLLDDDLCLVDARGRGDGTSRAQVVRSSQKRDDKEETEKREQSTCHFAPDLLICSIEPLMNQQLWPCGHTLPGHPQFEVVQHGRLCASQAHHVLNFVVFASAFSGRSP